MSLDNELKSAVLAELKWEPSVEASHIGVTTKDGVVTLMGHVASYAEKQAAEAAASRVKGVKAKAATKLSNQGLTVNGKSFDDTAFVDKAGKVDAKAHAAAKAK